MPKGPILGQPTLGPNTIEMPGFYFWSWYLMFTTVIPLYLRFGFAWLQLPVLSCGPEAHMGAPSDWAEGQE